MLILTTIKFKMRSLKTISKQLQYMLEGRRGTINGSIEKNPGVKPKQDKFVWLLFYPFTRLKWNEMTIISSAKKMIQHPWHWDKSMQVVPLQHGWYRSGLLWRLGVVRLVQYHLGALTSSSAVGHTIHSASFPAQFVHTNVSPRQPKTCPGHQPPVTCTRKSLSSTEP